MPRSFTSDTLKPMISVQNLVLRSRSLTLNTTCPIFLTLIGVVSSLLMFISFPNRYGEPSSPVCLTVS